MIDWLLASSTCIQMWRCRQGTELEIAASDEMEIFVEEWETALDDLETQSSLLLEQLDGAGIELPSLYKWIESQAPSVCCTDANAMRRMQRHLKQQKQRNLYRVSTENSLSDTVEPSTSPYRNTFTEGAHLVDKVETNVFSREVRKESPTFNLKRPHDDEVTYSGNKRFHTVIIDSDDDVQFMDGCSNTNYNKLEDVKDDVVETEEGDNSQEDDDGRESSDKLGTTEDELDDDSASASDKEEGRNFEAPLTDVEVDELVSEFFFFC